MYTVLGDDGKEYGPATTEQILAWKRDGRVDDETKVRRAGEAEWVLLAEIPELSGRAAPDEDAPPPLPEAWATEGTLAQAVPASGPLDPLACFERAWEVFKANGGLLIGACAIVGVLQLSTLLHPVLGYVFAFAIAGPLYGGLSRLILLTLRGTPPRVAEVFSGFRIQRNSLVQASAVRAALELLVTIPFILHLQDIRPMPVYLLAICGAAGIYISLAYVFTFPLVIDRGLGFWEAMESSRRLVMAQPFRVFLVLLLAALLVFLGLLCFLAGAVVTLPVAMVAYCLAYEHITRAAD
ncbi:MAG: GYF domain-containing protein [Opitutaceae bacterium]|nr:GYF domain-containing protein [Opitutaceae bacterium]